MANRNLNTPPPAHEVEAQIQDDTGFRFQLSIKIEFNFRPEGGPCRPGTSINIDFNTFQGDLTRHTGVFKSIVIHMDGHSAREVLKSILILFAWRTVSRAGQGFGKSFGLRSSV